MSGRERHPLLGIDRQASDEPLSCSNCCAEIPEDHVPTMLWSHDGKRLWVYCDRCDEPMLDVLTGSRPAQARPGTA